MAIYHTRIKTYSRAKGHSALAAAAYRGGYLLTDPKSGARHDYGVGRASSSRVAWHHLVRRHGRMTRKHFGICK